MKGLEIIKHESEGYKTAHSFESWRVAYLSHAERFQKENLCQLERHLLTDEIFMLLSGEGTLIIGEEPEEVPMEKNVIYNVKQGVWHAIYVSEDALVFIVENQDTGRDNTEYREM